VYCEQWVAELARATAEHIHAVYKKPIAGYVRPIIDHAIEVKKVLTYYKACK
jgi:deoxyribodipyrimidine photolyase